MNKDTLNQEKKKENYDNILEAKFSLREERTKAIKKGVSLVNI